MQNVDQISISVRRAFRRDTEPAAARLRRGWDLRDSLRSLVATARLRAAETRRVLEAHDPRGWPIPLRVHVCVFSVLFIGEFILNEPPAQEFQVGRWTYAIAGVLTAVTVGFAVWWALAARRAADSVGRRRVHLGFIVAAGGLLAIVGGVRLLHFADGRVERLLEPPVILRTLAYTALSAALFAFGGWLLYRTDLLRVRLRRADATASTELARLEERLGVGEAALPSLERVIENELQPAVTDLQLARAAAGHDSPGRMRLEETLLSDLALARDRDTLRIVPWRGGIGPDDTSAQMSLEAQFSETR